MKIIGMALVFLGILAPALADDNPSATSACSDWRDHFSEGTREFTAGGVAFFSPANSLSGRPTINYAGAFAQLGYMLGDVSDHGAWSGNFEGLVEGFGTTIYKGRGDYIAGTTLGLRYNVIPERGNLVPYFQAGAGLTLTDVDRRVLGQDFNFNLNLAVGLRYFVVPNCSLNAEFRYQHISNAGMSEHNLGIDAQGAVLSLSWFF